MKQYVTDESRIFECTRVRARPVPTEPEMRLVKVYPHIAFQRIIGFGAALTEASAYTFGLMDAETKDSFMRWCFGEEGNRYSLCRTSIQSCDFSLGPRAYLDERDETLAGFSIDGDREHVIPFVKAAQAVNPALQFLASPWSPPAWAKTNRDMKRGGHLRKDDYGIWSRMIAKAILEYRTEGIPISRITLQNEPNATQTWESCRFNASQEAQLAIRVRKELDAVGLNDVKILIWDHNKEGMFDRTSACLADPEAAAAIGGVAFHWYSGDHFPAVRATALLIGDRELIFTEGCCAYSGGDSSYEIGHAEHYAREIVGDLEAGAQGIIDWNILLDEQGGPNHVGNFCDAPIMYDRESGDLNVRLPFHYLGHFSRFIQPGAVRVLSSSYTTDLETTCFKNPDGTFALVALNRTDYGVSFDLTVDESIVKEHLVYRMEAPAHSILTATW